MEHEQPMNISFLSTVVFIAVFAAVVFVHELGHFIAARLRQVEVEEFGFGLPPRLMTLFHWKGTAFTLNWLPFGGFVRPKGENDPSVPGGLAASSPWTRLAVLFAGPLMNLLLGVLVFSLLFHQMGVPDYSQVQITDILPDSPAARAGIQVRDMVLRANDTPIHDPAQLRQIIYSNLDRPIEFTLSRGGAVLHLTATPSSARTEEEGALGIAMGPALVPARSVLQIVGYGSLAVYGQTRALILLPAQMLRGQINSQDSRFIGLKGIYDLFGQAVSRDVRSREMPPATVPSEAQPPTFFTLQLIGILTVSLGVFNLFPIPALDGGRILFVIPELLLRRRVPPNLENIVHAVGMALLLAFMLYVNVMDFLDPAVIGLP